MKLKVIPKIVIDTNVIVAALKSQRGASNKLLQLFGTKKFIHHISVPLILEYEEVIKRLLDLSELEINDLLNYISAMSRHTKVYFLWRPHLKDPKDDMVLELAIAAQVDFIVTYNKKDLKEAKNFGIELVDPRELLVLMGELP